MSVRQSWAVMGATAALIAALAASACGSPGPPLAGPGLLPVTGQPSTTIAAVLPSKHPAPVTTPPATTAVPAAVSLGTTVNVTGSGAALAAVNATAIVDPAAPAYSYDSAGPGQRFVAVRLQIINTGATALQENAFDDTSILVSTGAAQTPVVTAVAGCSSFVGGAFALGPGSGAADSCVTFELPIAATVKVVHFALGGNIAGQGSWAAP